MKFILVISAAITFLTISNCKSLQDITNEYKQREHDRDQVDGHQDAYTIKRDHTAGHKEDIAKNHPFDNKEREEGSGYYPDWLRPRDAPANADLEHSYNDHGRGADVQRIQNQLGGDYDEELTFEDFLQAAQEFNQNWDDDDPEETKVAKRKEFVTRYANFILPIVILSGIVGLLIFVGIGVLCCCAWCGCTCFDGLKSANQDHTQLNQTEMQQRSIQNSYSESTSYRNPPRNTAIDDSIEEEL